MPPPDCSSRLADNQALITERIVAACARSGRETSSVSLVAVTKYAQWSWVEALFELGLRDLGESRPQQLLERSSLTAIDVCWHLIGHLQRNKVRSILPLTSLIHSVDSLRLLERIDSIAHDLGMTSRVLLEVNVSGEQAKDGFSPKTLLSEWKQIISLPHVQVEGLMTMAPRSDQPEHARPHFSQLRELRDELRHHSPETISLDQLSMGMSGDFEIAIEEGATIVRIGSLLYEGLS